MFFKRSIKVILTALVVFIFATIAYAYAASNTLPTTISAGEGDETISGYTVENVTYNLNSTDPKNIDSVEFDLSPDTATTVKVQLVSGGAWLSCDVASGHATCPGTGTSGVTAAAANNLTVVAAQ